MKRNATTSRCVPWSQPRRSLDPGTPAQGSGNTWKWPTNASPPTSGRGRHARVTPSTSHAHQIRYYPCLFPILRKYFKKKTLRTHRKLSAVFVNQSSHLLRCSAKGFTYVYGQMTSPGSKDRRRWSGSFTPLGLAKGAQGSGTSGGPRRNCQSIDRVE